MKLPEQAVILLVENRDDDASLVRRALHKAGVPNPFFAVQTGMEALSYLEGIGKYRNREKFPFPDIMLLDLKLPRMSGYDVIQSVRRNPEFKPLRIIVLTSQENLNDVNKAYELGANSFLVMPLEFENWDSMMRTLSSFWLHHGRNLGLTLHSNGQANGNGAAP